MPARAVLPARNQFAECDDLRCLCNDAFELDLAPFVICNARDQKMLLAIFWFYPSPF